MCILNGYRILKIIFVKIYNSGMNVFDVINFFLIGLKFYGREYMFGFIFLIKIIVLLVIGCVGEFISYDLLNGYVVKFFCNYLYLCLLD